MTDPWLPLRRQCQRFIDAHRGTDASAIVLGSITVDIRRACEDVEAYWAAQRAGTDTVTITGAQRARAAAIAAGTRSKKTEEEKP